MPPKSPVSPHWQWQLIPARPPSPRKHEVKVCDILWNPTSSMDFYGMNSSWSWITALWHLRVPWRQVQSSSYDHWGPQKCLERRCDFSRFTDTASNVRTKTSAKNSNATRNIKFWIVLTCFGKKAAKQNRMEMNWKRNNMREIGNFFKPTHVSVPALVSEAKACGHLGHCPKLWRLWLENRQATKPGLNL